MAPQNKQAKGTLLGFFKKVDGPAPKASPPTRQAATSSKSASTSQPSTSAASSSSQPPQHHLPPVTPRAAIPPSPPTSVSAGSVSPSASTGPSRKHAASPSSPDMASLPNPFKTPIKPTPSSSSSRSAVTVNPRSGLPTPPTSSPLAADEDDQDDASDEEDVMPSISRVSMSVNAPPFPRTHSPTTLPTLLREPLRPGNVAHTSSLTGQRANPGPTSRPTTRILPHHHVSLRRQRSPGRMCDHPLRVPPSHLLAPLFHAHRPPRPRRASSLRRWQGARPHPDLAQRPTISSMTARTWTATAQEMQTSTPGLSLSPTVPGRT